MEAVIVGSYSAITIITPNFITIFLGDGGSRSEVGGKVQRNIYKET